MDWSVGNVYWTDTKDDQIWLSRYGGGYMNVLIRDTHNPSYLVIDTNVRFALIIELDNFVHS